MGVVVAGVHAALDERVAIKLLSPEALTNAETVARFQREARAAVRIKSEHVARVLDVGVVDPAAVALQAPGAVPLVVGAPFIVMERLEGQDLAGVLRSSGALGVRDATAYVAQAIEAIAEAHALGIVHRDLKPSNLFLTQRPDGTPLVKVLDFGISKVPTPGTDVGVTTTTAILGSPMYMAPEQMIASRDVDGRADVWALGVVLHQLLSNRGPFPGTTVAELCARILREPPAPIRQARPDVPEELERVVARCLEKDRNRRYPSVADLAEALVPFGGAQAAMSAERARRLIPHTIRAEGVARQEAPPSSLGAWVVVIVAFAALVLGGGVALVATAHHPRVAKHSVALPAPSVATVTPTLERLSGSAELEPLRSPETAPSVFPKNTPRAFRPLAPATTAVTVTTTEPVATETPAPTATVTAQPSPQKPDIF
jgi:serine/threonine-protein kinase